MSIFTNLFGSKAITNDTEVLGLLDTAAAPASAPAYAPWTDLSGTIAKDRVMQLVTLGSASIVLQNQSDKLMLVNDGPDIETAFILTPNERIKLTACAVWVAGKAGSKFVAKSMAV